MEESLSEQPEISLVALTHKTKVGALLQRPPEVEMQIRDALTLPSATLVERAREIKRQEADFIKDETLVYFIRLFHKSVDKDIANQLSEVLISRWTRFIHSKLNGLADSEDAYCAAISTLFTHILFRDDGRGDYLQVRFGSALKRIAITVFRKKMARTEDESTTETFTDLLGDDLGTEDDLEDGVGAVAETAYPTLSLEESAIIADALSILKEPLRTAFILRHMYDFQIESIDPVEPTLSEYFGKTPRTIRSWLRQAEKILKGWQGENRG